MFTPDTVQFENRDGSIIVGPFPCKYESKSQLSNNDAGGTTQTTKCQVMVQNLLDGVSKGKYMQVSNNGRDLGEWIIDEIEPQYIKSGFHHNLVYGKLAE